MRWDRYGADIPRAILRSTYACRQKSIIKFPSFGINHYLWRSLQNSV